MLWLLTETIDLKWDKNLALCRSKCGIKLSVDEKEVTAGDSSLVLASFVMKPWTGCYHVRFLVDTGDTYMDWVICSRFPTKA